MQFGLYMLEHRISNHGYVRSVDQSSAGTIFFGRGYYHRKTGAAKSHRSDITTGGGTNSHRDDIATGGGTNNHRSAIATDQIT